MSLHMDFVYFVLVRNFGVTSGILKTFQCFLIFSFKNKKLPSEDSNFKGGTCDSNIVRQILQKEGTFCEFILNKRQNRVIYRAHFVAGLGKKGSY